MICRSAVAVVLLGLCLLWPATASANDTDTDKDTDPWLGRDKLVHFGVSTGLAFHGYLTGVVVLEEPWQRALLGAGLTLGLGAAKEGYDAATGGRASGRDFAWNTLGAAVGVGVGLLIDYVADL